MPDLTQAEETVLAISWAGEDLLAIGNWREPILDLANRGLMDKVSAQHYRISPAGIKIIEALQDQDERETTLAAQGALRDSFAIEPEQ